MKYNRKELLTFKLIFKGYPEVDHPYKLEVVELLYPTFAAECLAIGKMKFHGQLPVGNMFRKGIGKLEIDGNAKSSEFPLLDGKIDLSRKARNPTLSKKDNIWKLSNRLRACIENEKECFHLVVGPKGSGKSFAALNVEGRFPLYFKLSDKVEPDNPFAINFNHLADDQFAIHVEIRVRVNLMRLSVTVFAGGSHSFYSAQTPFGRTRVFGTYF